MYLSIDCEMGGLGLDKSLLTASFILANEEFQIVNELNLSLIPNDGIYRVEPRALEINQVNLIELAKTAITYKEAGSKMYQFISKFSDDGKSKLLVVGKNVHGDLLHIWDKCISRNTWENFVSYRIVEVSAISQFLKIIKRMPDGVDSLTELCDYYKIKVEQFHDARQDAIATLRVLEKMTTVLNTVGSSL